MNGDRKTGRTTRLIDGYVQSLFNNMGEFVTIKDHFDHPLAHMQLIDKLTKRIALEHSGYVKVFNIGNRVKIKKIENE